MKRACGFLSSPPDIRLASLSFGFPLPQARTAMEKPHGPPTRTQKV
jgi:hypothetical protein